MGALRRIRRSAIASRIARKRSYSSSQGGQVDNTITYQDLYLETAGTEYQTDFTPADIAGLDDWFDLSAVTGADIPDTDDLLATVQNLGDGSDITQATSANRPLYKTTLGKYAEPSFSGTYNLQDSWYRYPIKCFRVASGKRMTRTPAVENPTYFERWFVFAPTAMGTIWSHRSEATRLIQVGVNSDGKWIFQLRSSGNSLQTLTSTVDALTGELSIVYIRFDKAGNDYALSVNGETEVTNSTNFGSETFNSTIETFGGFNNGSFQNGAPGNFYEMIGSNSALSVENRANILQYLRWKYLNYGLSPTIEYTPKSNVVEISPGQDFQSIIANLQPDTHVRFKAGTHEASTFVNNALVYIDKSNINIELEEGAVLKVADNCTEFNEPELVFNQLAAVGIEVRGEYTDTEMANFWIKIDGTGSPNTFRWHKQLIHETGEPNPYTHLNVPITGDWQALSDGIEIRMATTGNALNSGAIIAIGATYMGIRVGTGFQEEYIENVKIFGDGTINMNQTNNRDHSQHSVTVPFGVLFHGRVRHAGVYGITVQDIHRAVCSFGDHNGTYNTGGSTTGGESFDAEFIDFMHLNIENPQDGRAGIEVGHPEHRGRCTTVRINHNTIVSHSTCIEPNFLLYNYSCSFNTVTRGDDATTAGAIHCWRMSTDGIVTNNTQVNSDKDVVHQSAPNSSGWSDPVNILEYNNVTE